VPQLAALVAEIRALRAPALLVAVDHAGGCVQRFREGFTRLPPMRRLGLEYRMDAARGHALARQTGWLLAAELRALGVDLAPLALITEQLVSSLTSEPAASENGIHD
jgi:beta-N-acetylhexosaminidase